MGTCMIRYLALGDSYTVGEGIPEDGRWPVQLAARLRETGLTVADPHILATTGWTTDELWAAMDAAEPLGQWDLVSLLIGVNDQYRGRPVTGYARDFTALLDRAMTLAGNRRTRVLVLSIPDWGVTPFARRELRSPQRIARELDAYNTIAARICVERAVAFVDITAISRACADATAMLAQDGLHPSAAQYSHWVEAALPVAHRLLTCA
jgi:lysophospholipase L1-like esterase